MRTLPLFKAGIHWTNAIQPGQCAVFQRDRDTSVPLTTDVTIFNTLPEARAWAESICAKHPQTRCDIYDSEGLANEPVQSIYNAAVRANYQGPKPARTAFSGVWRPSAWESS